MDRKLFLELCQKCAVLPDGVMKIKQNIPDDYIVIFENILYYPVSYKISFDNFGMPQHIAVLHSMKANGIVECDLNKIKLFKEN